MKTADFNQEAKLSSYIYAKSPVHGRGFLILKQQASGQEPVPVGDYTVLDKEEEPVLTEKKLMNLVSLLNGRKHLMELGHETGIRILYHIVKEKDEEGRIHVLFYKLGQEGVSVENALLRIERDDDVWN